MPFPRLSVADAFDRFESDLKLRWLAGDSGRQRVLTRDAEASKRPRLLGPLNYNSANRIQLLGAAEIRSFSGDDALSESRFEFPLTKASDVFMVSDGLTPPAALAALADANDIALIGSSLAYGELLKGLRYGLTRALAEREIVHGVMMDVLGTGVLITGDASVGKSELALELISRGHILVADDAPEFSRIAPNTIECRCPPLLQDFLEVRDMNDDMSEDMPSDTTQAVPRLSIVTGLSGSGKSVALHTLEDEGFFCIDNLPAVLLPDVIDRLLEYGHAQYDQLAIGIDMRSERGSSDALLGLVESLRDRDDVDVEMLFLDSDRRTLITRFSETRRRHPLSSPSRTLTNAIDDEARALDAVKAQADLVVDTSQLNLHDLRELIRTYLLGNRAYLTVSIGCTGGRHRSVYLSEALAAHFSTQRDSVSLRHRELDSSANTRRPDTSPYADASGTTG